MPATDFVTPLNSANVQAKLDDDTRGDGTGVGKLTHLNCKLILSGPELRVAHGILRSFEPGTWTTTPQSAAIDAINFQFELENEWSSWTLRESYSFGIVTQTTPVDLSPKLIPFNKLTVPGQVMANKRSVLVFYIPTVASMLELEFVAQVEGF
jgi:hypothetical protein